MLRVVRAPLRRLQKQKRPKQKAPAAGGRARKKKILSYDRIFFFGGAYRIRTGDLFAASEAL